MKITKNLQSSFDNSRDAHLDKLDFLKSLWLDKEFAEKCALMFEQIWATTKEILDQKQYILKVNDELSFWLQKLDEKRKRLHRASLTKSSK